VQSKKESKTEREEKTKCQGLVKKGVEKKSLLKAGESGEALVKLEYSRIRQNIEINGENGCLMSKKRGYSGTLVGLWREQQTNLPLSNCPHA